MVVLLPDWLVRCPIVLIVSWVRQVVQRLNVWFGCSLLDAGRAGLSGEDRGAVRGRWHIDAGAGRGRAVAMMLVRARMLYVYVLRDHAVLLWILAGICCMCPPVAGSVCMV